MCRETEPARDGGSRAGCRFRHAQDATEVRRRENLARAAVAGQAHPGQELLDGVVHGWFGVGLSLQTAINLPSDAARERITEALGRLDDTIHEIRDHSFAFHDRGGPRPNLHHPTARGDYQSPHLRRRPCRTAADSDLRTRQESCAAGSGPSMTCRAQAAATRDPDLLFLFRR